ncbi:MAG: M15 family metallopeptidase [Clostridia bacterium]|nr:M15 family metallopeptidase [Clostridia bacterium]
MTRDLNKLHPYVKYLCERLITECKKQGISIVVTGTLRTKEEQDALYAQGRTKPGPRVTNAKGGQSIHNFGLAFDIAVLNKDGKTINWSSAADTDKDGKKDYYEVGAIGKSIGLTWGGDFRTIKDLLHFEWNGGLTLKDLQAGKVPANPLLNKKGSGEK